MSRIVWLLTILCFAPAGWPPAHAADDPAIGTAEDGDLVPSRFEFEIVPLLTVQGCAAAKCHGGASGRGGFKLSLFGTDPAADHRAMAGELGGRRIDLLRPSRSLLIRKPTTDLPHGGGRRMRGGDPLHDALLTWLGDGAGFHHAGGSTLTELHLQRESTATSTRFVARATFTHPGGRTLQRDVSEFAQFSSTDENVIAMNRDGTVEMRGPGEAWVLARYLHLTARSAIRRPFPVQTPSPERARSQPAETRHPVDEVWRGRLQALGLTPAPPATPAVLMRRLCLQLVGRPPTPDELREFLAADPSARTSATVRELLRSPAFALVFSEHLFEWWEIEVPDQDRDHTRARNRALRTEVRRQLTDAEPMTGWLERVLRVDHAFLARFSDPRDRAEFVGRSLLGIRLGCARCHNHPRDRWTRDDHLAFSALFADPRPDGGARASGMMFHPESGAAVVPRRLPLDAPMPDADDSGGLAFWIAEAGPHQLARNLANRLCGVFLGTSLVSPADDHRLSNPARHEELLDVLAARMVETDLDLREAIHFLLTSRLYAASSRGTPADPNVDPARSRAELAYFARREARALAPRAFQRAVYGALGLPPSRSVPPETPLAFQLHLLNGSLVRAALDAPGNQVEVLLTLEPDPGRRLRELFEMILSREPSPAEVQLFEGRLGGADSLGAGRELAAALMMTREFGSIR